jgi:hypothetical protein
LSTAIDFKGVIEKFDKILERGLCVGVGRADGQMCIEAAITQAMGLPFNDEPACVSAAVCRYKIRLNDSLRWKSPESRAKGLRDLGIAQIGSAGVVEDREFSKRLAEKTIRVLIPTLFRDLKVTRENPRCMAAADRCEKEGSYEAAREARAAAAAYADADAAAAAAAYADAAAAAAAYADAAYADAYAAAAADAAYAAAYAAAAAAYADADAAEKYLLLSASLALEVLRELKSPGCEWVEVSQ